MSVDYNAKLGYGYIIDHKTAQDYYSRCTEEHKVPSDFFHPLDYWNTNWCNYWFGIELITTDDIVTFDASELFDSHYEQWEECAVAFKNEMPELAEDPTFIPHMLLMQEVF